MNAKKLFYDESQQVGLNQTGIEQAHQTAELLKNIKFDICYCSPRKRAVETAQILLKYHPNTKIVYDSRIVERDWGQASGKHVSVCEPNRWHVDKVFDVKGVEDIFKVYERVKSFYDQIYNPEQNILVVSHSGVAKVSNCYFNGFPQDGDWGKFHTTNTQVVTFEKNKKME
jgi:probable phosphoglycerate mutase